MFRNLKPRRLLRRMTIVMARLGPYRFVTKHYFGTSDIAMTSRLLDVEAFRHDIVPQPLPVKNFKSILVLAPHQDDEVIGAGGAMIVGRDSGAKISIVYITDGRQHGVESETRRSESREVCRRLGAEMFELNISNIDPRPTRKTLERLLEIIDQVKPDVILSPWFLDGAPKHRMVNHILWLANRLRSLPNVEIWGYQVQNTLLPNAYVNITDAADEKRELLALFKSQNGERHWEHVAMGLAAWNSRLLAKSNRPLFIETFLALPADEALKLIERFYFNDLSLTYVGEPNIAEQLERLHRSIEGIVSVSAATPAPASEWSKPSTKFFRPSVQRRK